MPFLIPSTSPTIPQFQKIHKLRVDFSDNAYEIILLFKPWVVCREFGIEKTLITCDNDYIASAKTV